MSLRLPNSVFVHVPRTGGTWIADVVERLGLLRQKLKGDVDSHFTGTELRRYWPGLPQFAVVRHPWTWVESRWSHAVSINALRDQRHFSVHREFDRLVDESSFERTIVNCIACGASVVGRTFFVMIPAGTVIVRFDRLVEHLGSVLSRLEGVSPTDYGDLVATMEPVNATSEKARQEGLLECSQELKDRFLAMESEYLRWAKFDRPSA